MNQQPYIEGNTMDIVTQNPNILSGTPCFAGTRVPVATLFGNLNDGATFNRFVEWLSGNSLEQVKAVWRPAAYAIQKRATH